MNTPLSIIVDGDAIAARQSEEHDFLVTSKEVARGYGVSEATLRTHKRDHADELSEGKHWVVGNTNTLGGEQSATLWTKRGVIRLGFFIRSERAKRFRDAAEDLVVRTTAGGGDISALIPAIDKMATAFDFIANNLAGFAAEVACLRTELAEDRAERAAAKAAAPAKMTAVTGMTAKMTGKRGWAARHPVMDCDEDLAKLFALALGKHKRGAYTADALLQIVGHHGLFRGLLSSGQPKTSLGILLTRNTGRTLGGITLTKYRVARQRSYLLARA